MGLIVFGAVPDQEPLLQHTGMLPLLQQDGRQNWQFNYAGRLEQLRLAASVTTMSWIS